MEHLSERLKELPIPALPVGKMGSMNDTAQTVLGVFLFVICGALLCAVLSLQKIRDSLRYYVLV
jgi:hypothetical protein